MQVRVIVAALLLAALLIAGVSYWMDDAADATDVGPGNSNTAEDPLQVARSPTELPVDVRENRLENTVPGGIPALAATPLPDAEVPPVEPTEAEPAASAEPTEPTEPAERLPELHASDAFVRDELSPWKWPAAWLARDGLMQRGATLLVNMSQGTLPRRQLGFLAPRQKFGVVRIAEDEYEMVTAGYARYDSVVNTVTRLPAAEAARLVHRFEDLLVKALAELGERPRLTGMLRAVANELAAVPEIESPIRLKRPNVLYTFADQELETLSGLQKQLLRMGPGNIGKLKRYAADFMQAYETPAQG